MLDKGILRVIDANFNRCKEGLRVVEDVFRFVSRNDTLRKKIRKLRHSLDFIIQEKILKDAILSRNSREDPGRGTDYLEIKRDSANSILYVNLQRTKESLR
ncbi:MAG: thiamine-phosphate pyrophosphorylase, partial [Candidatus Omnitrophica bacterium]|nr:thiamine-phosphate pyrophosphorylase [Candidatus Omnitrophota bacterium]